MKERRARRILITGATDGLGLAMANKYASHGELVLATGRKPLARPSDIFEHDTISYVRADQLEPANVGRRIIQAMDSLSWSGCDLVILNAGIGWVGNPVDETAAQISDQITTNLTSTISIAHAVSSKLFNDNGQLTLIGSVAHKGVPNFATYAATKSALRGFARSLCEEWRGKARVQILHPIAVRTGMHKKAGFNPGVLAASFMGQNRAANALMAAIHSGTEERTITRSYAFGRGWRVPAAVRN